MSHVPEKSEDSGEITQFKKNTFMNIWTLFSDWQSGRKLPCHSVLFWWWGRKKRTFWSERRMLLAEVKGECVQAEMMWLISHLKFGSFGAD